MPRSLCAVAYAVAVLSLVAGGVLVLWPSGWAVNRLVVFLYYRAVQPLGLAEMISLDRFDDLLNVALFVPLVAALTIIRRTWWWVVAGVVLSGGIELFQALVMTQRYGTVTDVISNSCGVLIGALIGRGMWWIAVSRARHTRHRGGIRQDARGVTNRPHDAGDAAETSPHVENAKTTPGCNPGGSASAPGANAGDRG